MSRKGNEITRALFKKVEKDGLPIDTTDWQQVRIQAAIAAMQGLISGGIYTSSTFRLAKERGQSGTEFIAQMATEFADDLIAELQKKG